MSVLGSMWFGPFYSLLPPFPSGRCNPQKIQAHLNESNFSISATCLLCCLIDLVPTRGAWFFWTMHCTKSSISPPQRLSSVGPEEGIAVLKQLAQKVF